MMVTMPNGDITRNFRCAGQAFSIYFTSADQWVVSNGEWPVAFGRDDQAGALYTYAYWMEKEMNSGEWVIIPARREMITKEIKAARTLADYYEGLKEKQ